jgi:phosphotriesterase-related protein
MEGQPVSGFIRTVLGDIAPSELGVCYAHEHLIIDPSYTTEKTPDFLLDDVDRCVAELGEAFDAGVRAMVDSMPMACGRNVLKLAEVSRRSGIHVLCPTGLHLRKYYPSWHWCSKLGVDQLAELFVREIEEGIDANDGNGPRWETTSRRAGLIKIASGLGGIDEHERRVFQAAAAAHRQTGAPILTHTEQGTAGIEQVELLRDLGADLRHVILSHTDRKPDLVYHRELLSSGVRVEYDSAFRWKSGEPNHTLELLVALLGEYPDQIVLGMDAARRKYWKHYRDSVGVASTESGRPGMVFLVGEFAERMRAAGIDENLIRGVFVTTPADAYAFSRGVA